MTQEQKNTIFCKEIKKNKNKKEISCSLEKQESTSKRLNLEEITLKKLTKKEVKIIFQSLNQVKSISNKKIILNYLKFQEPNFQQAQKIITIINNQYLFGLHKTFIRIIKSEEFNLNDLQNFLKDFSNKNFRKNKSSSFISFIQISRQKNLNLKDLHEIFIKIIKKENLTFNHTHFLSNLSAYFSPNKDLIIYFSNKAKEGKDLINLDKTLFQALSKLKNLNVKILKDIFNQLLPLNFYEIEDFKPFLNLKDINASNIKDVLIFIKSLKLKGFHQNLQSFTKINGANIENTKIFLKKILQNKLDSNSIDKISKLKGITPELMGHYHDMLKNLNSYKLQRFLDAYLESSSANLQDLENVINKIKKDPEIKNY